MMLKTVKLFAYTGIFALLLTDLGTASGSEDDETGHHTPTSSRKRANMDENTPRSTPDNPNKESPIQPKAPFKNRLASQREDSPLVNLASINEPAVRVARSPRRPQVAKRLKHDDESDQCQMEQPPLDSPFCHVVITPSLWPQHFQTINEMQSTCQTHAGKLQDLLDKMNREQTAFMSQAWFYFGEHHPSYNNIESFKIRAKTHFASNLSKIYEKFKLSANRIPLEEDMKAALESRQKAYDTNPINANNKKTFSFTRAQQLGNILAYFKVHKIWIEHYFAQALTTEQQGTGSIFQFQLDDVQAGFTKMLTTIEQIIDFALRSHEDAYLIWPHNKGQGHDDAKAIKHTWDQLFDQAEPAISTSLSTLRNTFLTYIYATGSDETDIDTDLKRLSDQLVFPRTSHNFGRVTDQHDLVRILETIEGSRVRHSADMLPNRTSLLNQMQAYYDQHYPDLAPHKTIVENSRGLINDKFFQKFHQLMIDAGNKLVDLIDSKSRERDDLIDGRRSEQVVTKHNNLDNLIMSLEEDLRAAQSLNVTGNQLLTMFDLLKSLGHNPDSLGLLQKSAQALLTWQSKLDEFYHQIALRTGYSIQMKTGVK